MFSFEVAVFARDSLAFSAREKKRFLAGSLVRCAVSSVPNTLTTPVRGYCWHCCRPVWCARECALYCYGERQWAHNWSENIRGRFSVVTWHVLILCNLIVYSCIADFFLRFRAISLKKVGGGGSRSQNPQKGSFFVLSSCIS